MHTCKAQKQRSCNVLQNYVRRLKNFTLFAGHWWRDWDPTQGTATLCQYWCSTRLSVLLRLSHTAVRVSACEQVALALSSFRRFLDAFSIKTATLDCLHGPLLRRSQPLAPPCTTVRHALPSFARHSRQACRLVRTPGCVLHASLKQFAV